MDIDMRCSTQIYLIAIITMITSYQAWSKYTGSSRSASKHYGLQTLALGLGKLK